MSTSPKVHNKYKQTAPADAIYIGRGSKWGNPYVIGKDGDRNMVCQKYTNTVMANPKIVQMVKNELKGKDLICFCAPHRCHGDFLLKLANS